MKDRIPELVFLLIVIGLVAGFWFGRRKGTSRLNAALARAHATGHAEASSALAAQLSNVVNVTAGNQGITTAFSELDESELMMLRQMLRVGIAANDCGFGPLEVNSHNDNGSAGIDDAAVLRLGRGVHVPRDGEPRVFGLAERDRNAVDRRDHPSSMASD